MSTKLEKSLRAHLTFDSSERPALFGVLGTVLFLHILGWGLFIYYNSNPQYHAIHDAKGGLIFAGAGALAYSFGLRHAFDADHISAIDDTTRLMLAKGKKPLGVGLFFSLGHSTIVLSLSVAIAFAAKQAVKFQKDFAETGGIIGASVSAFFLYLVGILNLIILIGVVKVWRQAKSGKFSHEHLEELLNDRGLMRRIFRGRFKNGFDKSWQLYPVGDLFGLGFDTATEVALLAISATACHYFAANYFRRGNVIDVFTRWNIYDQSIFMGIYFTASQDLLQPHHYFIIDFCCFCYWNYRTSDGSCR